MPNRRLVSGPRARDLMLDPPLVLRTETPAWNAVQALMAHRLSGAPVIDAEGRLAGALSELDCLRVLASAHYDEWPDVPVQDVMTREVPHVSPDDHLLTLAHCFQKSRARHLPVISDDGRLLGHIPRSRLIQALMQDVRQGRAVQGEQARGLYLSALEGVTGATLQ